MGSLFLLKKKLFDPNKDSQENIGWEAKSALKWNLVAIFAIVSIFSFIITTYQFQDYKERYEKVEEDIFVGVVVSDPTHKTYKDVYQLKVIQIGKDSSYRNTKLLLQIKKQKEESKPLMYGDQIIFQGIYESPMKQRNTGGFKEEQYFKSKQLYGRVTMTGKIMIQKKNQINGIARLAHVFQKKIKEIVCIFPEDTRALLLGIILGDKEQMDDEIQQAFADSNLAHLLAVSGAHVGYILSGMIVLLNQCRIHKKLAKMITIMGLFFFLFVTNFTPSVTRACFMGVYLLLGELFHKKPDTFNSLCASLLIQIIGNPFCIFSLSLLLSYGGTIGILAFHKSILERIQKLDEKRWKTKIKEMIAVTLSAQIVIFPICLYQLGTVSFTFLISNLLAGPLLGIILLFGFLILFLGIIFLPLAKLFFFLPQIFLFILLSIARFCAKLPFSKVYFPIPSMPIIIAFYTFLLFFWYQIKRGRKIRIKQKKQILSIFLILIFGFSVIQSATRPFSLHFIDVGQGDSSLVVSPRGKKILIDGGGSRDTKNFDIGKQILLPYLLRRGITSLDYVIVSHLDSDHCQGLFTIMEELKVENVMIGKQFESCENYEEFIRIIKEKKIKVQVVEAGQSIKLEKDLYIDILWPSSVNVITQNSINNNSLVCKLVYQNFSMLFTGDIEEIAEKDILEKYKDTSTLKAILLKVAHHGSKSSSIKEFLSAVNPKIALIGVGEKNTFGHPNQGVLEKLEEIGCKMFRTDLCGEITIRVNRKGGLQIDKMIE